MVHILLIILKVIGIVLLVLLFLVLFLLLSLLFVPVRYQGEIHKKRQGIRNLKLRGNISWMFGGISLRAAWEYPETKCTVRIFGKRVYPPGESGKNKKNPKKSDAGERRANPETEEGQVRKILLTEEQDPQERKDGSSAEKKDAELTQKSQDTGQELLWEKTGRILGNLWKKITGFIQSVFRILGKILGFPFRFSEWLDRTGMRLRGWKCSLRQWKEFLTSEPFRESVRLILRELVVLWKTLKPRKLRGELTFGFEDPAETGQLLGMISLLYPSLPAGLKITPVFEQSVFEAEVYGSGRIYGITLVRVLWHLYRDRNIRIVYRKFQNKEA